MIRVFTAHTLIPIIAGKAFLDNNPHFLSNFWIYDHHYHILSTGLPRGLPLPGITTGHIARARLFSCLTSYQKVLNLANTCDEVGSEWRDLSDVSHLLQDVLKILNDHGINPKASGSYILAILWALVAKTSTVVFWMSLHLYSNLDIAGRVLAEMKPFLKASQPPQEFGVPEPPRLHVEIDGLLKSCPTLKACYVETLRLYSNPWSSREVTQDVRLRKNTGKGIDQHEEIYCLKGGGWLDIPYRLQHMDPDSYRAPQKWVPDRHLNEEQTAGQRGNVRYGAVRRLG